MEKYMKQIEEHLKTCGVEAAKDGQANPYGYAVYTVADCISDKNQTKNSKKK